MMNHLKEFSIFENKDDLDSICKEYRINNYTINIDGSINVNQNINMVNKKITKLPPVKINKIFGTFNCSYNNLTSLEGSPEEVLEGSFNCSNNEIISLVGGPKKVDYDYKCSINILQNLEGSPERIGHSFMCYNNRITTLVGGPKKVGYTFNCTNNRIDSLLGMPTEGNTFEFSNNRIMSLDSFKGSSAILYKANFNNNPIDSITKYFISPSKRDIFLELFEYCDIIRGKEVIFDRLDYFFSEIKVELTESILNDIKRYYKVI